MWIGASSTNAASNRTFTTVGFQPVIAVVSVRIAGRGVLVSRRGAPSATPALLAAAHHLLAGPA